MNEILTKIEQGIEAKVSPANKEAYDKAVIAGMKIMFDEKTHANMQLIKNPASRNDPINTVSEGVSGLVWLMFLQSKKTMKAEVLIMSAVTLMCKVFDFAERGLGMQITNDIIAKTTKKLAENLFTKMGITPDQLNQAIQKGHAEIVASQNGQQPVDQSSTGQQEGITATPAPAEVPVQPGAV